jgi:hypothetical protein
MEIVVFLVPLHLPVVVVEVLRMLLAQAEDQVVVMLLI